jgi:hypothetical protein
MWRFTPFLIASFSTGAWAQTETGPYVGFGLGQLDYEESDFGLTFDDTALAYKVYGGYRFTETWAVEAYYGQTADLEWSDSGSIPGVIFARLSGDYETIEIRALAYFNAFVVGIGYWDADLKATLSGTLSFSGPFSYSASDSDSGASAILGGEWDIDQWSIRGEIEVFDTDSNVDAYTVGVGLHFRF